MTAIVLDGIATSTAIRIEIAQKVKRIDALGVQPGLGSILVGDDGASKTYVDAKIKACEEAGIASHHEQLPASTTQAELERVIDSMNANPSIDAILVQLPLPKGLDEEAALMRVLPEKDVDGLHPINMGRLAMNVPGPLPCTPAGIVELLKAYKVPTEGKDVVILGRGLTIGRPLALLMAMKSPYPNAAVTVVHTGVKNIADYTRQADIIISAVGQPGVITADMVKPGAAVVGGGITREGKKILSDIHDGVAEVAGWMTPRIGGVGPMTIAMLLANTVRSAERRLPEKRLPDLGL